MTLNDLDRRNNHSQMAAVHPFGLSYSWAIIISQIISHSQCATRVLVVVLYSPNTNRYITDTCKTNNSIKHIWQVAREALVLSQLATYGVMLFIDQLFVSKFVFYVVLFE